MRVCLLPLAEHRNKGTASRRSFSLSSYLSDSTFDDEDDKPISIIDKENAVITNVTMANFAAPILCANPKESDWKFFKRQFENYLTIVKADDTQKLPLLINCVGRDGLLIYDGLPDPKDTYTAALKKFEEHFSGRTSILLKRKSFYEARQGPTETATDYACRLRRLVAECDLASSASTLLRDIFVIGVADDRLGERLLSEDATTLTFELAVAKAEAFERGKVERATSASVHFTSSAPTSRVQSSSGFGPSQDAGRSANACYRCGSLKHFANYASCPARNAVCRRCSKTGHFEKTCRSTEKPSLRQTASQPSKPTHVHGIQTFQQEACKTDSDSFDIFAAEGGVVRKDVVIDDQPMCVILDSGAEVNAIPRHLMPDKCLSPTDVRIRCWGKFEVPVLGQASCRVACNSHELDALFYFVDIDSDHPLFSLELFRNLGLLAELSCVRSDTLNLDDLVTQFPSLFDSKDCACINTGSAYRVTLKDNFVPYCAPARRVPPALLPKVKVALDEMVSKGVIRKVEGPTENCAPMVVAFKPTGDVRICCDFRKLNQSLKREMHQMPTFDELSAKVKCPKFWSRLDCKNSFWQIPIHPDSQEILTFSTPFGRFCYQTLPFGIASAPEVFTRVLQQILEGIENILLYVDDIVITAEDREIHDSTLRQVCERLSSAGVRLNREKCAILVEKVDFLGHVWSAQGISSDPQKLQAIRVMPLPTSRDTLRSFLGLAGYIGYSNIPHFSTLTRPLWNFLKASSSKLQWDKTTEHAFEVLRAELLSDRCRAYFDPQKKTIVQTDASPTGLGSVLLQDGKVVMFASRNLTQTESRYSQIEREFLGIVFGLKRFSKLLFGINFELQTDHMPIVQLFKKPIDSLSNRLQRWLLTIQHFSFMISHIKGTKNVLADCLSRNSIDSPPSEEEVAEHSLCFIMTGHPINLRKVAEVTSVDEILKEVAEQVQGGWKKPVSKRIRHYYLLRNELTLKICHEMFVVCRGDRVIIPSDLTNDVLRTAHEGHCGVSKMKANIRCYAYWPSMDSDVESFVRKCTACTVYQTRCDPPPLQVVADNVSQPWEKISIDLTGPSALLENKVLLTIIDLHSRFPEVFILNRGTTHEILGCLRSVFARFGLPQTLISDNGTVFASQEFGNFLDSCGIVHVFSSLYHPRGNSTVERLHGTLKSRLKRIRMSSNIPFDAAVDQVLYDIRSSPSDVTGETPFSRLFNRPMSTKLSCLNGVPRSPNCRNRDVQSEYAKRYSRSRIYEDGQRVLIRKGDGKPFIHEGEVCRQVGRYTYLVRLGGRIVCYNQRNMKPLYGKGVSLDEYEEADKAYDAVRVPCGETKAPSISLEQLEAPPVRRYPVRSRRPPAFYGKRV